MFNDLMANIAWFFKLHDNNKDGYLTKDEVLKVSESLLVSRLIRIAVDTSFGGMLTLAIVVHLPK